MWGWATKPGKAVMAAVLGLLGVAGIWAVEGFLDELKAKLAWSWIDGAVAVLSYAKLAAFGFLIVATVVAGVVLVSTILRRDPDTLRDQLLAIPSGGDAEVADAASAAAADAAAAQPDTLVDQALIIPDLIEPGDPTVRGKTFINCAITGPAIIEFTATAQGRFAMMGCFFDNCDSAIYRDGAAVQTAIAFEDCRFVDCRFYKVLLLFPADTYDSANMMIQNMNWITEPPLPPDPRQPPAPDSVLLAKPTMLETILRQSGQDETGVRD